MNTINLPAVVCDAISDRMKLALGDQDTDAALQLFRFVLESQNVTLFDVIGNMIAGHAIALAKDLETV